MMLGVVAPSAFAQQTVQVTTEKQPGAVSGEEGKAVGAEKDVQEKLGKMLSYWSVLPFNVILLPIAIIPLLHGEWWESHLNKGTVSVLCSLPIMAYLISFGPLGQGVISDILLVAVLRNMFDFP